MAGKLSPSDVGRHNKVDDVWLVVNGKVFDFTEFAPRHPGGSEIIYRYAGQDASREYNEFHAPTLIERTLEEKYHVGVYDGPTAANEPADSDSPKENKPPLHELINLYDFEEVAKRTFTPKGWAYIGGASNDNITHHFNNEVLKKIWFRPSVMKDVREVKTNTTLFGCKLDIPVYIAPTAAVSIAGPDGELAEARGAASGGIIATIPTMASYPHSDVLDATPEHAFFQLYVSVDRKQSEAIVRNVTASGKIKAIFVTVDLPVVSKREADERLKVDTPSVNPNTGSVVTEKDSKGGGFARQTASYVDPSLNWDDLAWLRSITDLPLVLKGIQRFEDAKKAVELGFEGIVLSNHGGRATDNAQPAILTLLELHKNSPEVFGAIEIMVDGGFRRGSDIVKAICLGASAVGLGRPFVYGVNYGQEGVERVIDILRDEIETAMRLIGITDLFRDASPDYLVTAEIDHLVPTGRHPYAKKIIKKSKL